MKRLGFSVLAIVLVGMSIWWYQSERAEQRLRLRSTPSQTTSSAAEPPPATNPAPAEPRPTGKADPASTPPQASASPGTPAPALAKATKPTPMGNGSRAERMEACADCHPEHVEGYMATRMGQSWGIPGEAKVTEEFGTEKATVRDPKSTLVYRAGRDEDGSYWQEEFHPATQYRRRMKTAFIVGSGDGTRAYLGWLGNELVEFPLTWYLEKGSWDLSPGYRNTNWRFNRRTASSDCLFCHNGLTPVISSAFAQFQQPMAQGIDCRRCHGDPEAHIESRSAGTEPPPGQPDPTIYNPGREAPARMQQVCDQCHLQGVARVAHAGQTWGSYDPKTPLHEVISIFFEAESTTDEKPRLLDLPYRIALGPCGQSNTLTCVHCHNPHRVDTVASYREACVSCHVSKGCSDPRSRAADAHCAGCHMQRQGMTDIPHAKVIDHFIRRRPEAVRGVPSTTPSGHFIHAYQTLRQPETERDANLVAFGLFKAFQSAEGAGAEKRYGEKAMSALSSVVVDGKPSWKSLNALAQLMLDQGYHKSAIQLLRQALALNEDNEGLWMSLAVAAEKADDIRTAIEAFGRVNALLPKVQRALAGEGKARLKSGDERGGVALLEKADQVSPHDPTVAATRGELAVRKRDLEGAKRWFGEAVGRDPLDGDSQLKLCGLLMASNDLMGAERCAGDALEFNPDLPGLYWVRARARLASGNFLGARPDLLRLIELNPKKPEIYAEFARVEAALGRSQAALETLKKGRANLGSQPAFDAVERELQQRATPPYPGR